MKLDFLFCSVTRCSTVKVLCRTLSMELNYDVIVPSYYSLQRAGFLHDGGWMIPSNRTCRELCGVCLIWKKMLNKGCLISQSPSLSIVTCVNLYVSLCINDFMWESKYAWQPRKKCYVWKRRNPAFAKSFLQLCFFDVHCAV